MTASTANTTPVHCKSSRLSARNNHSITASARQESTRVSLSEMDKSSQQGHKRRHVDCTPSQHEDIRSVYPSAASKKRLLTYDPRPHRTLRVPELSPSTGFDVKILSPTTVGIKEAARFIRQKGQSSLVSTSGFVSIPTEKEYSLFCFVPFHRPINHTEECKAVVPEPLDAHSLFEMDRTQPPHISVVLHHPIQAYNFVAFSERKSFVYKHRITNHETSSSIASSQLTKSASNIPMKITISESHEVLNRLSSSFWPGAPTIFAPVKTRKLANTCNSLPEMDGPKETRINGHDSMASICSFTSLTSEDNEGDSMVCPQVPAVPDWILFSAKDLHIPGGGEEKKFVGMSCPSHPIARKFLLESYRLKRGNKTGQHKGAVVRLNMPSSPKTCEAACNQLLSLHTTNHLHHCEDVQQGRKPVIPVVNGEDYHEQFSVPPCQLGDLPSVSLVIDTPNRNVILLQSKSEMKDDEFASININIKDVKRALCPLVSEGSVKERAIAAIMSKWSVTQVQI